MAGRMYLGNQMVTPAIVSGGVDSVNGQTGEVVLTASDVNALPDTTKYAKTLGLSMNQTTFVLSWQLYDQNGDPIGQVQTVDLPLESVVVNATYDSTNKKIVLTLENGTTIDVPVGDLVAGLQSEITITNMLSSDLVDDTNKTHKFVTIEEKTTWNNKQNAINDLATIRAGASAGATAVQPAAIANMQTTTNLVTEVDDDSTDTQYPSAKAVYAVQTSLEELVEDEARTRTRMDNQLVDRINSFYSALVPKTTTVNGKALSSDITLDASDVGALPDSTVIPTDTSDLTNGAGFITGITSSDVTTALGYTPYSNTNPAGYTSNVGTVTSVNNVQPDANGNVTISTGAIYTAGTGIDITNNEISVTSQTLTNIATGNKSLTILGNASRGTNCINIGDSSGALGSCSVRIGNWGFANQHSISIGYNSYAGSNGSAESIAIGYNASAGTGQNRYCIAIGNETICSGFGSINLGSRNTLAEEGVFQVNLSKLNSGSIETHSFKLLDYTGKIPEERLPIATSVSSSSTNADVVGAKLFYDTCGDIETLINAL